jgi:energy-coupling factor transporter ATP-binding protein EcfA2
MSVKLQVSDLRSAIYQATSTQTGDASGNLPAKPPTTPILGQMFHETFASLVGNDPHLSLRAAIEDVEPLFDNWQQALVNHTYHRLVGPRLQQKQSQLHHLSEQVLGFWDATQDLCRWLAGLLIKLHEQGDEELATLDSLRTEQSISIELNYQGWTQPVLLTGIADAIWQSAANNGNQGPQRPRWMVIELKTGRSAPEADLAQVCLYHLMLRHLMIKPLIDSSGGEISSLNDSAIALLSFPGPSEKVFSGKELVDAEARLIQLIGRLAGVIPGQPLMSRQDAAAPVTDNRTQTIHPSRSKPELKPEHGRIGEQIIATFQEYGISIRLDSPIIAGPTFLRFPIIPGDRVRLRAIEGLSKELQLRLRLNARPRIGTEGGRVLIDIERPDRKVVPFSAIRWQLPDTEPLKGSALVPLGIDIDGRLRMVDFARPENAHLLVAGSTGSGKSEWLRTALAGLVLTNSPATLQLLLIDPKRNAFHRLRHSPFLYCPLVFPDEQPVANVLAGLADEMDRRYHLFSENGDDSINSWVERTGESMPRIFCVCDEYADLILVDRPTRQLIEQQITRLGQKARAAGIHLIIATQQPGREIIRGVLDANIPARVGLRMQKAIESKMLLNLPGAENLLGRGDLLFKDVGEPIRLQAPYLSPEEAREIFGD